MFCKDMVENFLNGPMFLQKLSLSPNKSYSTSTTLENIIENLHLSYNHIPIITPYTSKSVTQEVLNSNLMGEKSSSILSIELYNKNVESFDCSHVVVLEYDLFEKFGYNLDDLKNPLITFDNDAFDRLILSKFHLNFEKEDAFVALFILTKLFKGKIISKKIERIRIFSEVFEIEWEITKDGDDSSDDCNPECIIFMDDSYSEKYNSLNPERIFIIGGRRPKDFESLKIDLSLAGKYKVRISDVYRSITPSVIKGRTKFDYERFKNIAK